MHVKPIRPQGLWMKPFQVSGLPCTLRAGHDQKRVDPRITGVGAPTGGLADRKGHDRLMHIVEPSTDDRPAICPTCGCRPTFVDERTHRGVVTANYVCATDHPWIVRWMETA